MKIDIKLQEDCLEPFMIIYTKEVTSEIEQVLSLLHTPLQSLTCFEQDRMKSIRPDEVYMIRVENEKVILYGKQNQYRSKKRLYELEEQLGSQFMRISKSALIHLAYLDYVEPTFYGMNAVMKNGCKEQISRKYLPALKAYLGL